MEGKSDGLQKIANNSGHISRGYGGCVSAGTVHQTGQLEQVEERKETSKRIFPQQIIDYRSMINQETRMGSEEQRVTVESQVSWIAQVFLFVFFVHSTRGFPNSTPKMFDVRNFAILLN